MIEATTPAAKIRGRAETSMEVFAETGLRRGHRPPRRRMRLMRLYIESLITAGGGTLQCASPTLGHAGMSFFEAPPAISRAMRDGDRYTPIIMMLAEREACCRSEAIELMSMQQLFRHEYRAIAIGFCLGMPAFSAGA